MRRKVEIIGVVCLLLLGSFFGIVNGKTEDMAEDSMAKIQDGSRSSNTDPNPKMVIYHRGQGYINDLTWSPMGNYFAFSSPNIIEESYGGYNRTDIIISNSDGTNEHSIGTVEFEYKSSPSWSHGEDKIVYSYYSSATGNNYPVGIMNTDGTNITKVIDNGGYPDISPDGQSAAYLKYEVIYGEYGWWSSRFTDLYKININGSGNTLLVNISQLGENEYFGSIDWSPDGSKLLFGSMSLWTVNSDGTNLVKLAESSMSNETPNGTWYGMAKWSPDGTRIVYRLGAGPEISGIYIMNADGSNKNQIISDSSGQWNNFPTWSPDGEKIAYVASFYQEDTLGYAIYILDLNKSIEQNPDSDGDGIPDKWEIEHKLNPVNATDAQLDTDKDGLTVLDEYKYGTDITKSDTDGDGLSDGVEIIFSKTDPTKKDTDNNGIDDGLDFIKGGYSANTELLPNNCIGMNIYWSDYVIKVVTNSSVLSATFDSSKEELSIDISGETGTSGFANITAPKAIINASEEIGVKLDGAPIEFTLTQNTTHYFIHIEYTHSTHKLTTSFEKTVGENANGEEKKAEPKGFIPGFETLLLLIVLTGYGAIGILRKKKWNIPP